jgi:diguanylate cyclase
METEFINVLIVDDNEDDREFIERVLKKTGQFNQIRHASNVEQGMSILEQHSVDVILLDYLMPRCDGIEMVLRIKDMDSIGPTAIVMISNLEDEFRQLECLQAGAHDFLNKSAIEPKSLRKAISHSRKRFELEQELQASYQRVKSIAEKDVLTGLSNRYYFEIRLKEAYKDFQRNRNRVALLVLDLDDFKCVNDTHGHPSGDELLKRVARRISCCLRGDECFSRIGGDEFAIILQNVTSVQSVTQVAKRILRVSKKLYRLKDVEVGVKCGVSIGISLTHFDRAFEQNLIKEADIALYRAKQAKSSFCYFEKEMQEEINHRSVIEERLRKAIESEQVELFYQPILGLENQSVVGFEGLLRWQYGGEIIYPDEFLSIAEESKLILDVGLQALESGLRQLKKWQQKANPNLMMSINLSPVQLQDATLVMHISECLEKYQLDPKTVIFELTETALLNDEKRKHETIQAIHELGCLIALDDFGTGFSSISYLLEFPIDIVKIDKSLIPSFTDDEENKLKCSMTEGVAYMLKSLDLSVVAEGVENAKAAKFCSQLNIDKGQGYFWGKAECATDVEQRWLSYRAE